MLDTELFLGWIRGLAKARQDTGPVEHPWGLRVETPRSREKARHVLLDPREDVVRAAAEAAQQVPYTWIKAFVDPQRALEWAGPGWQLGGPEMMMTAPLRPAEARVAGGYEVSTEVVNGVVHVRVRTGAGELAADGYTAVVGTVAAVDRVATHETHRRRGLGSLVMRTLGNAALEQGAELAVLGATAEGQALYESLGWTAHADLTGLVYKG
ncbi:GNAT family N-acetyltransferase [Kitasatospora sp. NPDC092948]|uniref:GNAT family N-acetyltransferase n=1 Tax=Kitasatospora sp. NPDC092948 TaxID=3364088 RepID=UPI0038086052